MSSKCKAPRISIGMPVFNGHACLENALDSLLNQTFTDFELIISDNASTDNTKEICEQYAKNDARIKYIRQVENIGATMNFKFVLEQAVGEYFMWAAADDKRSPDFLELNYNFLVENSEYVASTSPNGFEGQNLDDGNLINFALEGEFYQRLITFFNYCWLSHGIFYSLVRTKVLKGCEFIGSSFIAADWAVDIYFATKGKVNRCSGGYMISGVNGVSSNSNAYKVFRNNKIEVLLPFYRLTRYVINLTSTMSYNKRLKIIFILVKLNLKAAVYPLRCTFFSLYNSFSSRVKKITLGNG